MALRVPEEPGPFGLRMYKRIEATGLLDLLRYSRANDGCKTPDVLALHRMICERVDETGLFQPDVIGLGEEMGLVPAVINLCRDRLVHHQLIAIEGGVWKLTEPPTYMETIQAAAKREQALADPALIHPTASCGNGSDDAAEA